MKKKTKYLCVVDSGVSKPVTRRVFEDPWHNRYIRKGKKWVCIEFLPCKDHVFEG